MLALPCPRPRPDALPEPGGSGRTWCGAGLSNLAGTCWGLFLQKTGLVCAKPTYVDFRGRFWAQKPHHIWSKALPGPIYRFERTEEPPS